MAAGTKSETPVMLQWRAAKAAYPHCIVFFRLGDFFELFYEDAACAARELDLTLTARGKNAEGEPVPMAGVPAVNAPPYAQRLVDKGYSVAFCDQLTAAPAQARQPIQRAVTHVLTPGLRLEPEALDARSASGLAATLQDPDDTDCWHLATADMSTGALEAVAGISPSELITELVRRQIQEVVLPVSLREAYAALPGSTRAPYALTVIGDAALHAALLQKGEAARAQLKAANEGPAEGAVQLLLGYVAHHRPGTLEAARWLPEASDRRLELDATALRHLELVESQRGGRAGTLLEAVDRTQSAAGHRCVRRWLLEPLAALAPIERRQAAVAALEARPALQQAIHQALTRFPDLERLATRIALQQVKPRELVALRRALSALETLKLAFEAQPDLPDNPYLKLPEPPAELRAWLEAELLEEPAIQLGEGDVIAAGVCEELDAQRELARNGKTRILELEAQEREATGIAKLRIRYNRVFGYYFEVSHAQLSRVPERFHRRQTLANAERFSTEALSSLEQALAKADGSRRAAESAAYQRLVERAGAFVECLAVFGRFCAALDTLNGFARLMQEQGYSLPSLREDGGLSFEALRHPVVEQSLPAGRFVANDLTLDEAGRLMLITGPNMGGKSTVMRQVALAVVMAQAGAPIAARAATLGLRDRVLTRVGASDDLVSGHSTFMVEMLESARILELASARSLVILDEIGRGTSTYDGIAIARAIAESLLERGAFTLFATHFHELGVMAEVPGVQSRRVAVAHHAGQVVFLHRLEAGSADRSFGVDVAELAGLPEAVVARARGLLGVLEESAPTAVPTANAAAEAPVEAVSQAAEPQLALTGMPQLSSPRVPLALRDKLRRIDLNRTTPLQALNHLGRLQRMLDGA